MPAQFWKVWEARTTNITANIKRVVDIGFWLDDKILEEYTPEDKYFYLYLMTNPHTTQLGIYPISPKIMAFELGYSPEAVKSLIDRFENCYGVIKFSQATKEIALKNYLKYSIVKGGKPVFDCLKKEAKNVRDRSLLDFVVSSLSECGNLNKTVKDFVAYITRNDNENDNENENENDNERIDPRIVEQIVDHLNKRTGASFTPKNAEKYIAARMSEASYNIEDFFAVIDKKCTEWQGTDMEQYLRPETLFGSKFERYLNAPAPRLRGSDGRLLGKESNGWEAAFDWMSGSKDD